MIHIFYSRLEAFPSSLFDTYYKKLPSALREKNRKYHQLQDRKAHLLSLVLLLEGLQEMDCDISLEELSYSSYGKPYLPDIEFNISHSADMVVCALGRHRKLGIDIEKIRPVDFSHFGNIFTTHQWNDIYQSEDPYRSFFRYWTKIESVAKADGRGLSIPLPFAHMKEEGVYNETVFWYLKDLELDHNYSAYLCSDCEVEAIDTHYVEFEQVGINGSLST